MPAYVTEDEEVSRECETLRETYHQLLVNNLRARELVRMSHDLMPINKPDPDSYDFREVMEIV